MLTNTNTRANTLADFIPQYVRHRHVPEEIVDGIIKYSLAYCRAGKLKTSEIMRDHVRATFEEKYSQPRYMSRADLRFAIKNGDTSFFCKTMKFRIKDLQLAVALGNLEIAQYICGVIFGHSLEYCPYKDPESTRQDDESDEKRRKIIPRLMVTALKYGHHQFIPILLIQAPYTDAQLRWIYKFAPIPFISVQMERRGNSGVARLGSVLREDLLKFREWYSIEALEFFCAHELICLPFWVIKRYRDGPLIEKIIARVVPLKDWQVKKFMKSRPNQLQFRPYSRNGSIRPFFREEIKAIGDYKRELRASGQ
jgi:hypothetical protein